MDYFDYIVVFCIGWILSSYYTTIKLRILLRNIAKEAGIKVEEHEEKRIMIPILVTESHEGMLLLYDRKNNFYCQATTLEELAKNLLANKNIRVAHIVHNQKTFWFVEGQVKENLNES